MTTSSFIGSCATPFVLLKVEDEDDRKWLPEHLYKLEGRAVIVRALRGLKMKSVQGFMNEIGAALQFFDGFGENWHAVKDCMVSLREWMPADSYVIVVTNAQEVLTQEVDDKQFHWFIQTMHEVGQFWSSPINDGDIFDRCAIPFHVILRSRSEEGNQQIKNRLGRDITMVGEIK